MRSAAVRLPNPTAPGASARGLGLSDRFPPAAEAGDGRDEGAPRRGFLRPPGARPDRRRKALEIAAVWTLVGIFIAAQRYLRGPSLQPRLALPWGESLAASLVTAYLWALLTPPVMRLARRFRPARGNAVGRIALLVLAAAGAALVHLLLTNLFWHLLDPGDGTREFVSMFLATLAFGGTARVATCFAIVGVTWVIDDYRTYRQTEIQASELERELVQTELEALKLRLHPSFLFNTLGALQPLIRTDPRAASRVVVQLGDVLRLALYDDATRRVPLKTEIDTMRLYLQIEGARLRDRLDVEFTLAPETLPAAVPSLVLMPLIESAVANGVERRSGRSRVEVRSETRGDVLTLRVAERGADASSRRERAPLDETFVEKARRRMELLYPGAHSVSVEDSDDGHSLSLAIPFTEESGSRATAVGARA
jgi:two-component system, LytTR family, sensor kinase